MVPLDTVVKTTKSQKAANAKDALTQFVTLIDEKLTTYFDDEISHPYGVSPQEKDLSRSIWEHIKEHNLRPAKRIRGSFVYYGYKLLHGNNIDGAMQAAMGMELIHTALLMHDDIMDEDDTRRGMPTSHEHYKQLHETQNYRFNSKHWGQSMALDVGDIALLAGHELIGTTPFDAELRLLGVNRTLRGIVNTGFGQAYDITLEARGSATEEDIINLHYGKTGIYTYENPLHVGAILAGGTPDDLALLSEYAIAGGIAFQLQDDILGLFGNPEKTGKPAHSDLRQGKMTLLIVKALELGSTDQVARLKQLWGKRDLTEEEAHEARMIVTDCGSLAYSHEVSVKWAQKAQAAIPTMREKGWDEESIHYLDGIAQYMVEREL